MTGGFQVSVGDRGSDMVPDLGKKRKGRGLKIDGFGGKVSMCGVVTVALSHWRCDMGTKYAFMGR